MLYNSVTCHLSALEGGPKISQKINEAHSCSIFMIFAPLFPKMTGKAGHQAKMCVSNLSFHDQCDYLPLPVHCVCNCFSAFWCKKIPLGEDFVDNDSITPFSSRQQHTSLAKRNVRPHSQHIQHRVMVLEDSSLASIQEIFSK